MKGKSLAIRRINKDMKEINKNPVEGIGISSLDNDPMKYVVNIKLMNGPYKNYCIQLLLTFPETYPSKPPKILIYPQQAIDGQYHHHIFEDFSTDENGHRFKKFCFDLLDNDFMSTKEENSGWNPSYTISSILLQVQNFISDPDMHGYIPPQNKIKQLMDSMKTYSRKFKIINDEGKMETIVHTWEKPFPEMFEKKDEKKEDKKEEKQNKEDIEDEKEKIKMQQIKDNLTCFMLKLNYIDDPEILLGYPIIQNKILGIKEKIELYPIPELLTYDGFMAQIGKQDNKLDFYFDIKFKSANNQFYNYWVPIYIDENHFQKNKTTILNSFSIIKYGAIGKKEYDFNPEQIFQILPNLLNKMIIGMFKGKSSICSSFIRCYFQYVLLFKKLCLIYEDDYLKYVNHLLNEIRKNKYSPDKSIIPDIGDFFMLLFFSNKDTNNEKMKKMWYVLFEEFVIRQAYWTFHEYEKKFKMMKLINKCFDINKEFDMNSMNSGKKFFDDLKKNKLFSDFIDIIMSDPYFTTACDPNLQNEKQVIDTLKTSIKKLISVCNKTTKESITEFLLKNKNLSKYIYIVNVEFLQGNNSYVNILYESFQVDIILKKLDEKTLKEVLENAFESQIGNKLLIITFFTKTKIEDKKFMEELEKNYGIYLEVDSFIKEMNKQLKEIKNYHDFFNYIGSEFGKDMNDLDILINCYQKAKEKKYIRANFSRDINSSQSFRGRGGFGRGRGGFGRGRGRGRGRGY